MVLGDFVDFDERRHNNAVDNEDEGNGRRSNQSQQPTLCERYDVKADYERERLEHHSKVL